jgi:periplasmic protein TonB
MPIAAETEPDATRARARAVPRPSGSAAARDNLTWPGQGADKRRQALLGLIALLHMVVLWALARSMVPASLAPALPTFVQLLPDTGQRPPVLPPADLPAPPPRSPQPTWLPVPDLVVNPTQAGPVTWTSANFAPAPVEVAAAAAAPETSAASAPAPARPAVTERQMSITEVAYLTPPVLDYPLAARRRREEGHVHVRVRVDAAGRPDQATVIRSSGHDALDRAALATVRATRFRPYTEDGVPRPFWVVMPLVFELDT